MNAVFTQIENEREQIADVRFPDDHKHRNLRLHIVCSIIICSINQKLSLVVK